MPIEIQLRSDWMPIKIQLYATWDPIGGNTRGAALEMNPPIINQSNRLPIYLNIHPLAEVQDCKGTPFEDFPRVLSTNRKPGFRALDQWEASISARFWSCAKRWTIQCIANRLLLHGRSNGVSLHCQWNANRPPIKCQLTTNWLLIDIQSDANWDLNRCQLRSNWKPIGIQ